MSELYKPALAFLKEVVHPAIDGVTAVPIKKSSTPATVYRLFLQSAVPGAVPATVIAKRAAPGWPDDPLGHEREMRFCAQILPRLAMPQPLIYFAGHEPDTPYNLVIMEDVAALYRFPPPQHAWTMAEIKPIMRAYARFHTQGTAGLPPAEQRGWLVPRHEQRILDRVQDIPAMARDLAAWEIWPEMPGLPHLFSWLLAQIDFYGDQSAALLHNDVYPPNAALPHAGGDVLLFDWEMVGWGLAEMDLAFMFLQPFGSDRGLDKTAALDHYWAERAAFSEERPSKAEREARQLYADALWAFWLVPVAHHMAARPFPADSFPAYYWQAMWAVLAQRLQALARPWQPARQGSA